MPALVLRPQPLCTINVSIPISKAVHLAHRTLPRPGMGLHSANVIMAEDMPVSERYYTGREACFFLCTSALIWITGAHEREQFILTSNTIILHRSVLTQQKSKKMCIPARWKRRCKTTDTWILNTTACEECNVLQFSILWVWVSPCWRLCAKTCVI